MDTNDASSETVVVLQYKDYGKEHINEIVEVMPCEDERAPRRKLVKWTRSH